MKRILIALTLIAAAVALTTTATPATAETFESEAGAGRAAASRLSNGQDNTCIVLDNGNVRCWGNGLAVGVPGAGTIGDDETPDTVRPVDVGAGRTVESTGIGQLFACSLLDNGRVRCWGAQTGGPVLGVPESNGARIGDNEDPTAIPPVELGGQATAIAAANFFACALLDGGDVRCWGPNDGGQLGLGIPNAINPDVGDDEDPADLAPIDLGGDATAIALGRSHGCAILAGGDVRCWGRSGGIPGAPGDIGDNEAPSSQPVANLGGEKATAISAGNLSTCAITDADNVWCWGSGDIARYSTGENRTIEQPEKIDLGGITPVAVSLGFEHACVLSDAGEIFCWGENDDGELGYGNTDDIGDGTIATPEPPSSGGTVDVGSGRTVLAVSAGGNTTCVLLDNETVRCWGRGGIIGAGTTDTVGDDELPGSVPVVNYNGSAAFTPLSPARIADTRLDKVAPAGSPKGILSPGDTIDVQVAGEGGVPDTGVYAVVLNVAMADPTGFGFVTAWPKGSSLPTAANLNVQDGNASNSVIVPLGDDGQVSLFSSGGGHLVVDVFGYFEQTGSSSAGRLIGVDPGRIFDTRPGSPEPGPELKVGAGDTFTVDVTGTNGVPETGVSAVVMNITAVRADGPGFVTVYPGDETRNETANINLSLRTLTRPNTVIMPVADDGTINIFTSTAAFLVGDVFGYFTDDTAPDTDDGLFVPVFPTRLLDSRTVGPPVPADGTIDFQVTGQVGIPPTGNAVVFNLAGVTGQLGFVTAYPNEITRPATANLNVPGPETNISNLAIVPLSQPSGRITLYSESGTHLVADTSGYFL